MSTPLDRFRKTEGRSSGRISVWKSSSTIALAASRPAHHLVLVDREQGDPVGHPRQVGEHEAGDLVAVGGGREGVGQVLSSRLGGDRSRWPRVRGVRWGNVAAAVVAGPLGGRGLERAHELRRATTPAARTAATRARSPAAGRAGAERRAGADAPGRARAAVSAASVATCGRGTRPVTLEISSTSSEVVGPDHRHVEVPPVAGERHDEVAPGERRRDDRAHLGRRRGELQGRGGRATRSAPRARRGAWPR